MRLSIEVEMHYRLGPLRTVMLAVEAARSEGQRIIADRLDITGDASVRRICGESGVGTRIWARLEEAQMCLHYRAEVDVMRDNSALDAYEAAPLHALPAEALTYLRPSRFCQSDEFTAFVGKRFGHVEGGAKLLAIQKWVAG